MYVYLANFQLCLFIGGDLFDDSDKIVTFIMESNPCELYLCILSMLILKKFM